MTTPAKRGRGRPPVAAEDRRDEQLVVRVSPAELEELRAWAAREGESRQRAAREETTITIKGAEKIIRALAQQDCEDDERRAAADAMPGRQIDGWREASVRAGDVLCVQAIDRLGNVRAQRVYDAAREAMS